MKNIKFSRLFAAFLFVACLAFTGCTPVTEEKINEIEKVIVVRSLDTDDVIAGSWLDNYEGYNTYGLYDCKITTDYVETAAYGKHVSPIYIKEVSEDSGYIFFKFSEDITGYGPAPEYEAFTVHSKNKWGAIAYKNLTDTTVEMCEVADKTYEFPETLEDCVKKYFGKDKYFAIMPEWTRL